MLALATSIHGVWLCHRALDFGLLWEINAFRIAVFLPHLMAVLHAWILNCVPQGVVHSFYLSLLLRHAFSEVLVCIATLDLVYGKVGCNYITSCCFQHSKCELSNRDNQF